MSSGAIAAGLPPLRLRARPRDLATQQAAASVGQGLLVAPVHRGVRAARPYRRPGPAHRRRPRPPRALPQRAAHAGQAARARRRPGRQRERHGGHRRDPVRRQRPAGRPGRAPGAGRPAGAAVRRRRAVRRRPAPAGQPPGLARCAAPADLAGVDLGGGAGPGRGRHRRHGTKVDAARARHRAGIPVLRHRGRRWPAPRWPGRTSAPASTRRATRQRTRLLWLAHAATAARPAAPGRRAVRAVVGRRHVAAAGRDHRGRRRVRRRRPGRPARRARPCRWPAGWSTTTPPSCPALLGRSTRDLAAELGPAYEREVVHRDDLVLLSG